MPSSMLRIIPLLWGLSIVGKSPMSPPPLYGEGLRRGRMSRSDREKQRCSFCPPLNPLPQAGGETVDDLLPQAGGEFVDGFYHSVGGETVEAPLS